MSNNELFYQIAPVSFDCPATRDDGIKDHPLHWYTIADNHFDFAEWMNDLDGDVWATCYLCKQLKITTSDDFWLRILNIQEFSAWNTYKSLAKEMES